MSDNKRPLREDTFGTRFLNNADEIWTHNAWDEVEFSKEKIDEIDTILEYQRSTAINDEKSAELIRDTNSNWDNFYGRHSDKFFMDRQWLIREFPEVFKESNDKVYALEVGCGAGNTTFPLLESTNSTNPNLFVYCCDFSPKAVELVRQNNKFNSARCSPFVWDITCTTQYDITIQEGSLDYILCVYVLSAISPDNHRVAIANLVRLMKKNAILYVKDYGRHDLTQLRFKKDKYIRENFYARGDGTLTYFFDANELHNLLTEAGLQKIENFVDKRMLVNRSTKQTMHRRWLQCKYNKKQLLRLACETLKYRSYLEKVLNSQNVARHLIKSKKLSDDHILCLVLIYELLFGLGIRISDKQIKQVLQTAKKDIFVEHEQLQSDNVSPDLLAAPAKSADLPRYVRVNTLKWSLDEALSQLKTAGFNLIDSEHITSQELFNEAVQNLQSQDFFVDIHVPNLLVFHSKVDLHKLKFVKDKLLILQDKASCLPAFILQPRPNSQVVDACAAPGMKTTHLAGIMNNGGTIWALDRDKGRCKTLTAMLNDSNVTNAQICNQDFLKEDTTNKDYSQIEYCLVDAPCSGSGMVKREDFMKQEFDAKRISLLSNLQSMILKHALKMPNLKRLVYSTCSIYQEENEKVVQEALNAFGDRFELVDPMPEWERKCEKEASELASKCLRATPDQNLTNGFFVALFQEKK